MATLTPSSDSDIKVEVWLPTSRWNNDFQAIGNGGWNGTMGYAALLKASRPDTRPPVQIPVTKAAAPASRSGIRKS